MPGRRKTFDPESRRARYAAAGVNEKLIFNFLDIRCTMRALYEGKGSVSRVLIVLNRTGEMTQKALTERLEIQPASVSDVLAKMESAGWVRRTPNQQDQRTMDVALTAEGVTQAEIAEEKRLLRHREMFSCLSDADKEALLALLEKINADWETRYPG